MGPRTPRVAGGYKLARRTEIAVGRLVPVLPGWASPISSLWAIWPGTRKPSRKVTAFLDTLLETLEAQPLS